MRSVALLVLLVACVYGSTVTREKRDQNTDQAIKDVEKEVAGVVDSIWGGTCFTDDQCLQYVSYCHKDSKIPLTGECQLIWWSWIVLAVVGLLLVSACVACICCPCCCLYACCSSILDCICCCCRKKGYSPANRG